MSNKIRESRLIPYNMQAGEGVPTHLSPAGTFYFDSLSGVTYQNIDGLSNWKYIFGENNHPTDIYVTGGTYDWTSGIATFVNNTGGTFTLFGFNVSGGAGTYPGGSQSVTVSLYATSRIWGQEIDVFSDERMKDIQGEVSLDDGLKLINNLKPIKYTWKSGEDKGLKVGYSAQQVSKSGFDHLVALMPREGLEETIDDDGFVSLKILNFQ